MIPEFADELKIVSVNFYEYNKSIFFVVEQGEHNGLRNEYKLVLKEIDGTYYPKQINHSIFVNECFCGWRRKGGRHLELCELLTGYVDEIYEQISEFPNVRLHLLFL